MKNYPQKNTFWNFTISENAPGPVDNVQGYGAITLLNDYIIKNIYITARVNAVSNLYKKFDQINADLFFSSNTNNWIFNYPQGFGSGSNNYNQTPIDIYLSSNENYIDVDFKSGLFLKAVNEGETSLQIQLAVYRAANFEVDDQVIFYVKMELENIDLNNII